MGEPISIGTLLELGNCSLDVLKYLVDRPPMQSVAPAKGDEKPLDVRDSAIATRRNLEAVLFYSVTQLAMWLAKPEFDVNGNDIDSEDKAAKDMQVAEQDRRGPRRSMTLAERLRRGMTGEMAADLQALLTRAKPVVSKSQTILDNKAVDLTQILAQFVQERIML